MKFLCTPRLSWLFFMALFLSLEVLRTGAGMRGTALAGSFFVAAFLVDSLVQSHMTHKLKREREEAEKRRQFDELQAEKDPNVLARLKHLSEEINAQNTEMDDLRLELKIALAERQKAEEEREDIRQVLNFNRTALRAEQFERQDLEAQLAMAKAGGK